MRVGTIAAAGLAVAALFVVWSGPPSVAAAHGEECKEPAAGAPNMAVIPTSSDVWAELRAATHVNGSVGFVLFEGITRSGDHTLVGPEGTEYGPRVPVDELLVFPDLGLCHTGAWTLRHDETGEVVEEFRVARDAETLGGEGDRVVIDHDFETPSDGAYQAGEMYTRAGSDIEDARANWTGRLLPEGYAPLEPAGVAFSATYDARVDAGEEAVVSVCAESEGEANRRCRSVHLEGPATCAGCTVTVPARWSTGAVYSSSITAYAWTCSECPIPEADVDHEVRDLVPVPDDPRT